MSERSIVLYLDRNLKFYQVDFPSSSLQLFSEYSPVQNKPLQLSDEFEAIWKENYNQIQKNQSIYLVLGERSGFSNTRAIQIWLNTWIMFFPEKEYWVVIKMNDPINYDFNKLMLLLELKKTAGGYAKEPRIDLPKTDKDIKLSFDNF
jgi:hypothetical protein